MRGREKMCVRGNMREREKMCVCVKYERVRERRGLG
jgi:hypothetical protein